MPDIPITFLPSQDSVGLELVDIFLWIFKRHFEEKTLTNELMPLIRSQKHRGFSNEISLAAISEQCGRYFFELPESSSEKIKEAERIMKILEAKKFRQEQ